MNYKERLKQVETLSQLIDLRSELLLETERFTSANKPITNLYAISMCQNIDFWIRIIEERIIDLTKKGYSIDTVEPVQPPTIPIPEKK